MHLVKLRYSVVNEKCLSVICNSIPLRMLENRSYRKIMPKRSMSHLPVINTRSRHIVLAAPSTAQNPINECHIRRVPYFLGRRDRLCPKKLMSPSVQWVRVMHKSVLGLELRALKTQNGTAQEL